MLIKHVQTYLELGGVNACWKSVADGDSCSYLTGVMEILTFDLDLVPTYSWSLFGDTSVSSLLCLLAPAYPWSPFTWRLLPLVCTFFLLLPYTWSSLPEALSSPVLLECAARCCLSLHMEETTTPHRVHRWWRLPLVPPDLVQIWELRESNEENGWQQW